MGGGFHNPDPLRAQVWYLLVSQREFLLEVQAHGLVLLTPVAEAAHQLGKDLD